MMEFLKKRKTSKDINKLTLNEWIIFDGPQKFYESYIKTSVIIGKDYYIKYDKLCQYLAKYVKEETIIINSNQQTMSSIDLAYNRLEDYICKKYIEIEIMKKYKKGKYLNDTVTINPTKLRKLVRRFSH